MGWVLAGVLSLLFASFFVGKSGRQLRALDSGDTVVTPKKVEQAASNWGAGATLLLVGVGLLCIAFISSMSG